jgi:hypothetical protein
MAGYFFQFVQPGQVGINLEFGAKALEQRGVYCLPSRIIRHDRLARVVEPAHERKVCSVILEDLQAFRYRQCRGWVIFDRFSPSWRRRGR